MGDDIFNGCDMITALLLGIIIGVVIGTVLTCKAEDDFDKFCPECGHAYKAEVEYCSYDGSELKMIREEDKK